MLFPATSHLQPLAITYNHSASLSKLIFNLPAPLPSASTFVALAAARFQLRSPRFCCCPSLPSVSTTQLLPLFHSIVVNSSATCSLSHGRRRHATAAVSSVQPSLLLGSWFRFVVGVGRFCTFCTPPFLAFHAAMICMAPCTSAPLFTFQFSPLLAPASLLPAQATVSAALLVFFVSGSNSPSSLQLITSNFACHSVHLSSVQSNLSPCRRCLATVPSVPPLGCCSAAAVSATSFSLGFGFLNISCLLFSKLIMPLTFDVNC